MKIIIFSVGKEVEHIMERMAEEGRHHIVCFVDNDTNKIGKTAYGKEIIHPGSIGEYEYDYIAIGSRKYYDRIEEQLLFTYKIDKSRIVYLNDFLIDTFVKKRYFDRYHMDSSELRGTLGSSKIVVYTAITGGYDALLEPQVIDEGVDYVCFTDNQELHSTVWNIEKIKNNGLDSSRLSRKFKTMPEQFFSDYDLSIWVDGNLQIRGSLKEYVNRYMRECNLLCFPHPWRNCLYEEAAVVKKLGLDDKDVIDRQIDFIRADGFPADYGLAAGSCLVRFHNEDHMAGLGRRWWSMVLNGSRRDQLSLTYACWKENVAYDISDIYIFNNKYLNRVEHK